jgi:integrase
MTRRRKEIGIRRKRSGWQAFVDVDGQFRSKQFAIDTPIAEMRAWRDNQVKTTTIAPATGSLAADILAYLGKPEIAARKYIGQVATHLEMWAVELGRDRSRRSVTQTEVETVIQQWLAAGLAPATVYHRRTAFGSFYTTMNGGQKAPGHNPVTGTTRPAHYQPVDRSVPMPTLARIVASMATDRYVRPGIRKPSLARLVAALIQATGIPPGELHKLRRPHFDRERAIVRMPWRDKGAGTPPHVRELSPEGLEAFVAFDAADAWGKFNVAAVSHAFKRAARRVCGPDTPIRLYDQRHSIGTDTYAVTGDLATVGRVLGHVEGSIVTHRYAMGAHATVDRAALVKLSAMRAAQVASATTSPPPPRAQPVPVTGAPRRMRKKA